MNEAQTEAMIIEKGKTAPRITPAMVDEAILSIHYANGADILAFHNGGEPFPTARENMPLLTICTIVCKNGFVIVGKSACASPENYDREIGEKVAFADARQQIWALEGYQLRTQLARQAAETPAQT